MRFFFDNTMPPKVVEALRVLDSERKVVHLTNLFDANTADEVWMLNLAKEGDWIVISGDLRISRNSAQRKAWLDSGLVAFFLAKGWTNLPLFDQAWRFLKWWPDIVAQASRIRPPAGFIVPIKQSKLEQLRI